MTSVDSKDQVLHDLVVSLGEAKQAPRKAALVSSPLLDALKRAGTSHIYADTADTVELLSLLEHGEGKLIAEVDGNTVNQPLVGKVVARYLQNEEVRQWAARLRALRPEMSSAQMVPLLYTLICARIGNDMRLGFALGRSWEVSLQLHMSLAPDREASMAVGRDLRRMVPTAFVKVPFMPQHPHSFLIARDLEREGIPVNFTSTFSARQVAAAALLADVTRTNIFMSRLNGGLKARLIGEHVDLEAQRALRQLRREGGVRTQLIVASMHDWQTFVRTAGCDVYTAPCGAIDAFLKQEEVHPRGLGSRLETSYRDELGIDPEVVQLLSMGRISRLWRVEPELVQFLRDLGRSEDYRTMTDGDKLYKRFDAAGFGDMFYAPSPEEWRVMKQSKLPDLHSELTRRVPIDTLYSLLADADFENYQGEIDGQIEERALGRA
jgi:transaldolase